MGLLNQNDEKSRYYGDFRGVDFSSDHTKVHDSRLAYCVNMYRDYQSGQGQALETVPGFRRRVQTPEGAEVFGIHHFQKGGKQHVLIHAGDRLYLWRNYPGSIGVVQRENVTLPEESQTVGATRIFEIPFACAEISGVFLMNGENITAQTEFKGDVLTVSSSKLSKGDFVRVDFIEQTLHADDALFAAMNKHRSCSFVFYDKLYVIDGKNYLVFDGEKIADVCENAYVPTTYIGIIPSGENADNGTEYEQRNLLSPYFKHTFVADGVTTEFFLNENKLEGIEDVRVYGQSVNYTADLANGKVTFDTAPKKPEESEHPLGFAGVEITAKKTMLRVTGAEGTALGTLIKECSLATSFDGRVFFSGHPAHPNHVFYCTRNATGYVDPSYVGALCYFQDGVGNTPITGMIPVANTLMVLKGDTQQDGAVFFHTPRDTGEDLIPRIYPAEQGLSGVGCLGACVNFLDDPVFVSRLGLEGVGQLSVRYERAIEHRSSLIDAKLVNLDLSRASLTEWNGYLLLLADGKIFMADSRQRYTHEIGTPQYEWYYLEGIGVYDGQYPAYRYAREMQEYTLPVAAEKYCTACGCLDSDCSCQAALKNWIDIPIRLADSVYDADSGVYRDLCGTIVNAPDISGKQACDVRALYTEFGAVYYVLRKRSAEEEEQGFEALLCESTGYAIGGVEMPARVLKTMNENLFFGTENGVVCSFNFDFRDEKGELPFQAYEFDGRVIFSGCATKMDCCGIPHLAKNTVKKSTVIKTKAFTSCAKIKVRTNKKPYEQVARINSGSFSFDNVDFAALSFSPGGQNLFAVREREKQWMEKQYFVYSDEYRRPFALYYIAYRYTVAGRYKG